MSNFHLMLNIELPEPDAVVTARVIEALRAHADYLEDPTHAVPAKGKQVHEGITIQWNSERDE